MLTASPITNQPVGKTFTVAISILGAGAALQLVLIGWAFWARARSGLPMAVVVPPSKVIAVAMTPAPAPHIPDTTLTIANANDEPPSTLITSAANNTPPRPTPLTTRTTQGEPATRFDELLLQGRELRDRNDTTAAIVKFREAASLDAKSPVPWAELGATFEKMQMADKAAENWRKVYDMGPIAGVYYELAKAKMQNDETRAMNAATGHAETTPPPAATGSTVDLTTPVQGIAPGATLGLLQVTSQEMHDDTAAKHFVLHVPIKARPKARIDVKDLVIGVLFYEIVDGQNIVQTNARVNYNWTNPPADWINSDTEELAVDYMLPKEAHTAKKKEDRKYYGYIVRIYYKQQLQGATAEPERLGQQYPPPATLPKDNDK